MRDFLCFVFIFLRPVDAALPPCDHMGAVSPLRTVPVPGTGGEENKRVKAANYPGLGRVLGGLGAKQLEVDSVSGKELRP